MVAGVVFLDGQFYMDFFRPPTFSRTRIVLDTRPFMNLLN